MSTKRKSSGVPEAGPSSVLELYIEDSLDQAFPDRRRARPTLKRARRATTRPSTFHRIGIVLTALDPQKLDEKPNEGAVDEIIDWANREVPMPGARSSFISLLQRVGPVHPDTLRALKTVKREKSIQSRMKALNTKLKARHFDRTPLSAAMQGSVKLRNATRIATVRAAQPIQTTGASGVGLATKAVLKDYYVFEPYVAPSKKTVQARQKKALQPIKTKTKYKLRGWEYVQFVKFMGELEEATPPTEGMRGMSLDTVVDLCFPNGGVPVPRRVFTLIEVGVPFVETEINDACAERIRQFAHFTKVKASHQSLSFGKSNFDTYLSMTRRLGIEDLSAVGSCPAPDLVSAINAQGLQKGGAYRMVRQCLLESGEDLHRVKLDHLKMKLAFRITGLRNVDRMKLCSSWTAQLITATIDHELEGLETRSSFTESHMTRLTSRLSQVLAFIADQVIKTYPAYHTSNETEPVRWFFDNARLNEHALMIVEFGKTRQLRNHVVKSAHGTHQAKGPICVFLNFLKGGFEPFIKCQKLHRLSLKKLVRKIPNLRVPFEAGKERTLKLSEIDAMMAQTTDSGLLLMITLLKEVALRNECLGSVRMRHLVDEDFFPRDICRVPQKNAKIHVFKSSPELKRAIKIHVDLFRMEVTSDHIMDTFLLNPMNPDHYLSTVWYHLKKLAKAANITRVNVHPHVFRHTFVTTALARGLSMEQASLLIGHENTETTSRNYHLQSLAEAHAAFMNSPLCEEEVGASRKEQERNDERVNMLATALEKIMLQAQDIDPTPEGIKKFQDSLKEMKDLQKLCERNKEDTNTVVSESTIHTVNSEEEDDDDYQNLLIAESEFKDTDVEGQDVDPRQLPVKYVSVDQEKQEYEGYSTEESESDVLSDTTEEEDC
jgi:integrase